VGAEVVLLLPESVEDSDELSLLDLAAVSDLESLEDLVGST